MHKYNLLKITLFFIVINSIFLNQCFAQSTLNTSADHNYTQVETILVSGLTTDPQIDVLPVEQKSTATQYLDLMGKPDQTIIYQGSPTKKDLIKPYIYDNLGRQSQIHLGYTAGSDNSFKVNPITDQTAFYQNLKSDAGSYGTIQFENSPLGRPVKQFQVGTAPQTNGDQALSASVQYATNAANEIIKWDVDATGQASGTAFYTASSLSLITTTDAGLMKSKTYKNLSGQVVCSKVQKVYNDETQYLTTYYVYDDFGNLRFIVPPMAVNNLAAQNNILNWNDPFCQNWLFAFQYDIRQRPIAKSSPNGGITYLIYDPLDRPILSQDQVQAALKQWTFIKYDVLGRTILKGKYTTESVITPSQMQVNVDNYYTATAPPNYYESRSNTDYTNLHGYSNQAFPIIQSPFTHNSQIYSVTYYDDYDFDFNGVEFEAAKQEQAYFVSSGYESTLAVSTKGMVTGAKDIVLPSRDNANGNTWIYVYSFYDEEGKVVQVQKNYGGEFTIDLSEGEDAKVDIVSQVYDFAGKLLKSEHRHLQNITNNTPSLILKRRYNYDHAGRTTQSYLQVDTEPEKLIASYTYNEIGELTQKNLGNNLQIIDYSYDINGRLTGINDKKIKSDYTLQDGVLYSLSLNYNLTADNHAGSWYAPPGRLNGRQWLSANTSEKFQDYYQFDDLGRISFAFSPVTDANNNPGRVYSVKNTYEDNGNLLSMKRTNLVSKAPNTTDKLGVVDNLTYKYNGNQLVSVEDAITTPTLSNDFKEKAHESLEYSYDAAGKLQSDKNKGISSISYNDLDLPENIIFDNSGTNYISTAYSASGEKVASVTILSNSLKSITEYLSGFVYVNDVLQFISHEEGRIIPPQVTGKTTWTYEYDYRDNLGGLVMSFRQAEDVPTQTATMEPISSTTWSFADGAVRNSERQYSGNYSAKLSSSSPIGAWKTIKVAKGDVITMGAYGSYTQVPANNTATNLIPFVSTIPLQGTETGNAANLLSLGLTINPITFGSVSSNVPNAYLEFILTGTDNSIIKTERQYISAAANSAWENIKISYTAEGEGYLQVFVANESDSPVWFDDVSIQVQQSPIAQETHYDIWGVELAGLEKRDNPEDEYKFQGKELIEDFGFYEYDFGARYYDPQLGRWSVTDALGSKGGQESNSPYAAMMNDPANITDPDGNCPICVAIAIGAIIGAYSGGSIANGTSNPSQWNWQSSKTWTGIGVGAVVGGLSGAAGYGVGGIAYQGAVGAGVENGIALGAISGAAGGAVSGSISGFGTNLLLTGDLNSSLKAGLYGGLYGAAIGGVTGAIGGAISDGYFRNAFKGKGFRSNNTVLKNFASTGKYQEELDYFDLDATYGAIVPAGSGKYIDSETYYGMFDEGRIYMGKEAFNNYYDFKATYFKESYHLKAFNSGNVTAAKAGDIAGEETFGFKSLYENRGLFPRSSVAQNANTQIEYYYLKSETEYGIGQTKLFFNTGAPSYSPFRNFLNRFPRLW